MGYSLRLAASFGDGEESDRDQPVPPGDDGWGCCRLPILGGRPSHPLSAILFDRDQVQREG